MRKCLSTLLLFVVLLLCGSTAFAQKAFKVSGTVSDENGEPFPGVTVLCQANKQGTITDANGNYSIMAASPQAVIQFTFMGYKPQEVKVNGRAVINVAMEVDAEAIEEAVISVGYGLAQKREDLVGSAFQVTTEQLKFRPAERMDNMLVGLVPGLSIAEESTNGRQSVKMRVRGDGSLSASNEPLWVIDGVPVYNNGNSSGISGAGTTISPISLMNPDDIESMTVLKDASTVALYGADGSNGVILVTTRKAKSGKLNLAASIRYGYSDVDPQTRVKFINAEQWMALAKEGWVNSGRDIKNFPYQDNEYQTFTGVDTNWYPYYQRPGSTVQVNLSASGGSEKMNSLVSAITGSIPLMWETRRTASLSVIIRPSSYPISLRLRLSLMQRIPITTSSLHIAFSMRFCQSLSPIMKTAVIAGITITASLIPSIRWRPKSFGRIWMIWSIILTIQSPCRPKER